MICQYLSNSRFAKLGNQSGPQTIESRPFKLRVLGGAGRNHDREICFVNRHEGEKERQQGLEEKEKTYEGGTTLR